MLVHDKNWLDGYFLLLRSLFLYGQACQMSRNIVHCKAYVFKLHLLKIRAQETVPVAGFIVCSSRISAKE